MLISTITSIRSVAVTGSDSHREFFTSSAARFSAQVFHLRQQACYRRGRGDIKPKQFDNDESTPRDTRCFASPPTITKSSMTVFKHCTTTASYQQVATVKPRPANKNFKSEKTPHCHKVTGFRASNQDARAVYLYVARRYVASKSNATRPKRAPPQPLPTPLLKELSVHGKGSKPSVLPFSKPGLLYGHRRQDSAGVGLMVSGVKEGERDRKIAAREQSASRRKFEKGLHRTESEVNDVEFWLLQRNHIEAYLRIARVRTVYEYRLSKIRIRVERVQSVLVSYMHNELLKFQRMIVGREEEFTQIHNDVVVAPVEKELDEIAEALDECRQEVDEIRKSRRRDAAIALHHGEQLLARIAALKSRRNEDDNSPGLRRNINKVTETIRDIVKEVGKIVDRLIRRHQQIPPVLTRISDVGAKLARPFRQDVAHTSQWSIPLRQIAHNVEQMEMIFLQTHDEHRDTTDFMFPESWAVRCAARYIWPWQYSNNELETEVHRLDPRRSMYSTARQMRANRLRRTKDFQILAKMLNDYKTKIDKILQAYTDFIGRGNVWLCPHPSRDFHHRALYLGQKLDRFTTSWRRTMDASNSAMAEIHKVVDNQGHLLTLRSYHRRKAVLQMLETISHPSSDHQNPFSRRGFWQTRHEVDIWHGLSLKYPVPGALARTRPHESLIRIEQTPMKPAALEHASLIKYNGSLHQARWLQRRSLYPTADATTIRLIVGLEELERAVSELLFQAVIGFDVVNGSEGGSLTPKADYVLMASMTNIYIFDISVFKAIGYKYFCRALGQILEKQSILKVVMNYNRLSNILWRECTIDINSVFELPKLQHSKAPTDFGQLIILLKQASSNPDFRVRDVAHEIEQVRHRSPQEFFYYLAVRAFAPLQLFRAVWKKDNVRSTDEVMLDLSQHKHLLLKKDLNLELGPVKIGGLERSQSQDQYIRNTPRPGALLRAMAVGMARKYLNAARPTGSSNTSRNRGLDEIDELHQHKAIAAFYLATMFGETTRSIETILGIANAAKWIIQASKLEGLELHAQDRAKFEKASMLSGASVRPVLSQRQRRVSGVASDIRGSQEAKIGLKTPQTVVIKKSKRNEKKRNKMTKQVTRTMKSRVRPCRQTGAISGTRHVRLHTN